MHIWSPSCFATVVIFAASCFCHNSLPIVWRSKLWHQFKLLESHRKSTVGNWWWNYHDWIANSKWAFFETFCFWYKVTNLHFWVPQFLLTFISDLGPSSSTSLFHRHVDEVLPKLSRILSWETMERQWKGMTVVRKLLPKYCFIQESLSYGSDGVYQFTKYLVHHSSSSSSPSFSAVSSASRSQVTSSSILRLMEEIPHQLIGRLFMFILLFTGFYTSNRWLLGISSISSMSHTWQSLLRKFPSPDRQDTAMRSPSTIKRTCEACITLTKKTSCHTPPLFRNKNACLKMPTAFM